jgi:small acid-soluble spore protein H (minor)
MQVDRAQEILGLENKITVELNGVSIWIDSVDPEKQTAKVHAEDNPADARTVQVEKLQEVH